MYQVNMDENINLLRIDVEGGVGERDLQGIIEYIADTIERSPENKLKAWIAIENCRFTMWQLPYLYKIKKLSQYRAVNKMVIQISERIQRNYNIKLGIQDYENFGVFIEENDVKTFLEM